MAKTETDEQKLVRKIRKLLDYDRERLVKVGDHYELLAVEDGELTPATGRVINLKRLLADRGKVAASSEPTAELVEIEPPSEEGTFAVNWAQAVLWAADHADEGRMTKKKAGSALRFNLYLLGKENLRELHVNLVPKALAILDQNKSPGSSDMIAAEEKSCEELLGILKQAVEESGRCWVQPEWLAKYGPAVA